MTDDPVRTHEPHDKLTRLADEMLAIIKGDDVKAIVMLTDETNAGVGMSGWEDDAEAVAFMLVELQTVMRASGKDMILMGDEGFVI